MANDLLSLLGWYFLPQIATSYLQTILYTIFIRAGEPKPAPGSPRHTRDRKYVHVAVILLYLLYTIFEADYQLRREGDFYQVLGVGHGIDEKGLQSKFRRLTVQHHPDKVVGGDKAEQEKYYLLLTLARDTLLDPAKRFAYDRFGLESLQWRGCSTIRDYVLTGVQRTGVYYAASGAVMVLLSVLGYLRGGMFWRYLVMADIFVVEVHVMTRPTFPTTLTKIINPALVRTGVHPALLPFQLLTLLRKIALTIFIALSQLTPILNPTSQQASDAISAPQLDRLDFLAKTADQEMARLMGLEVSPFAGEPSKMRNLRQGIREWLVSNTVRNDAEVKRAVESVLARRRAEGSTSTG